MFTSPNVLALIATLLCILVNASPVPISDSGLSSSYTPTSSSTAEHISSEGYDERSLIGVEQLWGWGLSGRGSLGEKYAGHSSSSAGETMDSQGMSMEPSIIGRAQDTIASSREADPSIIQKEVIPSASSSGLMFNNNPTLPILPTPATGSSTILASVAHVNESWSFRLPPAMLTGSGAENTAKEGKEIGWTYTSSGFPAWVALDEASGALSGTPVLAKGTKQDRFVGEIMASPTGSDSSSSITTSIDILVVPTPGLTVLNPVTDQLSNSSTIPKSKQAIFASASASPLGPDGVPGLVVPPGWSFSIGLLEPWAGLSSGKTFLTAMFASTSGPLPGWLKFKNTTLVFEGVAPGSETSLDIALSGSQVWGRQDAIQTFSFIVSGKHNLDIPSTPVHLAWVVGQDLNVTNDSGPGKAWWDGPSLVEQLSKAGGWETNGRLIRDGDVAELSVNTSGIDPADWISVDNRTRTLAGTPPPDALGKNLALPLTIVDPYGDVSHTTLNVTFEQPAFDSSTIAPLAVPANSSVSVDLTASFGSSFDPSAYNVSISLVPRDASSWLSWNASAYTLTGTRPTSVNYSIVSVGFHATSLVSDAVSHSWMNLSLADADDTDASVSQDPAKAFHHGGLSHTAHIALIATGAAIGGILLLCALIWYCGRYVEREKHVVLEDGYDVKHRDSDASDVPFASKPFSVFAEKDPGWFKQSVASGAPQGLGLQFSEEEAQTISSPQVAFLPYDPGKPSARTASHSWRRQIARAAKRPVTKLFISSPTPHAGGSSIDYVKEAGAPPPEESTPAGLLASVFSPALPVNEHPILSPTSTIHPPIRPWGETPVSGYTNGSEGDHCPGTDFSDDSYFATTTRASWQTGSTREKIKSRDRAAMLTSRHGRPGTGTDSVGDSSIHSPWTPYAAATSPAAGSAEDSIAYQRMTLGATFGTASSASVEVAFIRTADRLNVIHQMGFESSITSALDAYTQDTEEEGAATYNLRAPMAHAQPGTLHNLARNRFVSATVALSQAGSGSNITHSRSMPSVQAGDQGSVIHELDDTLGGLESFAIYHSKRLSGHSAASSSALRDALDETPPLPSTPTMARNGQSPAHSRKSSRRGAASPLSSETRSIVGTATPSLVNIASMSPYVDSHGH